MYLVQFSNIINFVYIILGSDKMPYKTRKVRGKPCYKVYNTDTKKVFSKCTDKPTATRQMRLLRAIQNSKSFVPYSQRNKTRKNGRSSKKNR